MGNTLGTAPGLALWLLASGKGILKVAREAGVGVSVVQAYQG
jgi:hypothetical protein